VRARYVVQRVGIFFLVVWAAASINFAIPRLSPANPIREALLQAVRQGGAQTGSIEEVVKSYEARFGLDQPLWIQYLNYLADLARFDFGVSIAMFPTRVIDVIMIALPWTILLLIVSTVISFILGTILGALMAWPGAPRWLRIFATPMLTLSAIPYYLLGLILIYVLAFSVRLFPIGGGFDIGSVASWDPDFLLEAIHHSILPALSILLAQIGGWSLAMRGMMVMTLGEDYMAFGEAKGLRPRRLFMRYALRNALLPQMTSLALALGQIASGAVLVEVVFGYPGVGSLLFQAVRTFDYFVIYGIAFMVIVAIGIATLILDLLLPALDPRITYQAA
jgi:peptide/nickel transport system permease protein